MDIGCNPMSDVNDKLEAWSRKQLDDAVQGLGELDALNYVFIEVRPAWVLPSQILVGKAREQGDPVAFRWFICGEVPLDHIPGDAANTPREVIRYFALKWQLDSEKKEADQAKRLIEDAESLYDLANDDRFWQESS
jgi:hypothetical protein